MSDISVVICTHNPRLDYLERVLGGLRAQTLPVDRWELIVIDNMSANPVATLCDLAWHRHARVVREDVLGLTPARLRGIAESSGELLVFVDDDNVLAPDFLEEAWRIYAAHPYLGAFGAGQLEPEFETSPSTTIRPYLRMLALRSTPSATWSNNPNDNQSIPWGAGLCVRRSVARLSRQFVERIDVTPVLDRRGEHLFGHGDDVFSWVAASTGRGFGVFPQLQITHLIGAARLKPTYILRLAYGGALSQHVLQYVLTGVIPRRKSWKHYLRAALRGVRSGTFSMQCLWQAFRGEHDAALLIAKRGLRPVAGINGSGGFPGHPQLIASNERPVSAAARHDHLAPRRAAAPRR